MTKKNKQREFFERLMQKNGFNKEKQFIAKDDNFKRKIKRYREDLFNMPLMDEETREARELKILELCEHFATVAKDRENENLFAYWPSYFGLFMTPRLFDIFPNSCFTKEIGFCFACKHFKGEKKGHYKQFHSLKRKVISLFGLCLHHKINSRNNRDFLSIYKNNNHVMPNYRCRGWEAAPFYEQLLKRKIYKLLTDENNYEYSIEQYMQEQEIDVYDFMAENANGPYSEF